MTTAATPTPGAHPPAAPVDAAPPPGWCNPRKYEASFDCDRQARSTAGDLCATHYMQWRRRKGHRGACRGLMLIEPKRKGAALRELFFRLRESSWRLLEAEARKLRATTRRHTGVHRVCRNILEAAPPSGAAPEGPVQRFRGKRSLTVAVDTATYERLLESHRRREPNALKPSAPAVAAEEIERWVDVARARRGGTVGH
jgi:hypothetical protein